MNSVALAIAMLCQSQIDFESKAACQQKLAACVLGKNAEHHDASLDRDEMLLQCVRERKNE